MSVSLITTHVLDTAKGAPAAGVPVLIEFLESEENWREIGSGITDLDGRIKNLLQQDFKLRKGEYRITFKTEAYFSKLQVKGFYPLVQVIFRVENPESHYHVPLLLSPYGYSTYRGS
jgi:5-hydroxyisourate hydrolase